MKADAELSDRFDPDEDEAYTYTVYSPAAAVAINDAVRDVGDTAVVIVVAATVALL